MDSLKTMVKAYEKWVASNPEIVCDLEITTKWISYFIAGRISDSNIISELAYSLSNIMVLYNDRIIEKSRDPTRLNKNILIQTTSSNENQNNKMGKTCYRLKVTLTALEYSEVFIEISAKRVFGAKGKWIVIAFLQILKAAGRFFLLRHSTEQIITSPIIPNLNRRALIKQEKTKRQINEEHSNTYQLKRSGRIIRKIEDAPPFKYRDLKFDTGIEDVQRRKPLPLLQAEYLYIAKPLIHLASIGVFGDKKWKQFLIALSVDLYSIHLYHKNRHLMNKQQKLELSRRCCNLIMYLMRSPLYDGFTKTRVDRVLDILAHVPLLKVVAQPIREYIPHWQNTYFYLWST